MIKNTSASTKPVENNSYLYSLRTNERDTAFHMTYLKGPQSHDPQQLDLEEINRRYKAAISSFKDYWDQNNAEIEVLYREAIWLDKEIDRENQTIIDIQTKHSAKYQVTLQSILLDIDDTFEKFIEKFKQISKKSIKLQSVFICLDHNYHSLNHTFTSLIKVAHKVHRPQQDLKVIELKMVAETNDLSQTMKSVNEKLACLTRTFKELQSEAHKNT